MVVEDVETASLVIVCRDLKNKEKIAAIEDLLGKMPSGVKDRGSRILRV